MNRNGRRAAGSYGPSSSHQEWLPTVDSLTKNSLEASAGTICVAAMVHIASVAAICSALVGVSRAAGLCSAEDYASGAVHARIMGLKMVRDLRD